MSIAVHHRSSVYISTFIVRLLPLISLEPNNADHGHNLQTMQAIADVNRSGSSEAAPSQM
jgi:hypothetical protein